jgi:hypothetical protein
VAVLHPSTVQALLSLQSLSGRWQPNTVSQYSFTVHGLLSVQSMGVWVQLPVAVSHPSVVQALLSLQRVAASQHGYIVPLTKLKLGEKCLNGPSTICPPL